MNRLLFAAARGARLQVMADDSWYGVTQIYMPFRRDARAVRIHPDDAHLAYGPVSTALREYAIKPPVFAVVLGYPVWGHVCEDMKDWVPNPKRSGRMYFEHVEELHRSLFLLILAEALAEEGL